MFCLFLVLFLSCFPYFFSYPTVFSSLPLFLTPINTHTHTHTHTHIHRSVHTVSGRQTSGLQGESSSPLLTVWIRHLLPIAPDPFPFPGSRQSKPDKTDSCVCWVGWGLPGVGVEDGWMTNGMSGLEVG